MNDDKHTIVFTMQLGMFKANAGDMYGEVVLQDGWYVVEKYNERTRLVGPIDSEALAILVKQDTRTVFHRAVGDAGKFSGA